MNSGTHSTTISKLTAFNEAKHYFANNPNHVKFKKASKLLDRSFIFVKNIIYSIFNQHFDSNAIIGKGGQGKVKFVETETGEIYKVKIEKGMLSEQNTSEHYIEEQRGNLIGVVENTATSKVYKVMTYVEGNSLEYELKNAALTPVQKFIIAIKLAQAIQDLHNTFNAVHGDIKPSNIIIQRPDSSNSHIIEVVLVDLGAARRLPPGQSEVMSTNNLGSEGYRAPEITYDYIYSTASDVYALGFLFKQNSFLPLLTLIKLQRMLLNYRHHRLNLDEVLDILITDLANESPLDDVTLAVIENVKAKLTVSGPTLKYTPRTSSNNVFKPLLHLIPRTIQASVVHGDQMTVHFDGKDWQKVTAEVDFANTSNQYWVSVGATRESIFFDSKSPKMLELINKMQPLTPFDSIHDILATINTIIKSIPIVQGLQNVTGYTEVHLDELIDKGQLVCRHKSLIAAASFAHFISQGILPHGTVRCYRTHLTGKQKGIHTFVIYRNTATNDLWIIDPTWTNLLNLSESKNPYHHISYSYKKQILGTYQYGYNAICDMVKRLDYEDIYKPFIERFNQEIAKGTFPNIEQIYAYESNSPDASFEIQLVVQDPLAKNILAIMMLAFAKQNIVSIIRRENENVISLLTKQPASFLCFNIDAFSSYISNYPNKCHHSLNDIHKYQTSIIRQNFKTAIAGNRIILAKWLINLDSSIIYYQLRLNALLNAVRTGNLALIQAFFSMYSANVALECLRLAASHNQSDVFKYLINHIRISQIGECELERLLILAATKNYLVILKSILLVWEIPAYSSISIDALYKLAIKYKSIDIIDHICTSYPNQVSNSMDHDVVDQVKTSYANQVTSTPMPVFMSLNATPQSVLTYLYTPMQGRHSLQLVQQSCQSPISPSVYRP